MVHEGARPELTVFSNVSRLNAVHHQSEPSTEFYIILRGKVEVKIANGSLLKAVNVLGRGDYL